MVIELSVEERNMLIVLLMEQEEKYPDQKYIEMGRRLRRRLHDLSQTSQPTKG